MEENHKFLIKVTWDRVKRPVRKLPPFWVAAYTIEEARDTASRIVDPFPEDRPVTDLVRIEVIPA